MIRQTGNCIFGNELSQEAQRDGATWCLQLSRENICAHGRESGSQLVGLGPRIDAVRRAPNQAGAFAIDSNSLEGSDSPSTEEGAGA